MTTLFMRVAAHASMQIYGLKIMLCKEVYEPDEDTFLLAEVIKKEKLKNKVVLEIGTGTGILALLCAKKAKKVVAVDINESAVKCAKLNAKVNDINNIEARRSDVFSGLKKGEKFDLIALNPPYLPVSEKEEIKEPKDALSLAWNGGKSGRKVINKFLECCEEHLKAKGKILLLGSSLSDYAKTTKRLEEKGFKAEIRARKRFFFEELAVIEAERK